ncbi:hypothetical protein N7540_011499 [Penicillium herquei]|nr:hypothetical protein N7540_011499 [Penicillium herquei]
MAGNDLIVPDSNLYYAHDDKAPDDWQSETTSLASSITQGLIENGRRYQTLRQAGVHVPADERMFETYESCHLVAVLSDSGEEENSLFQAPIIEKPLHILDIGTGKGTWAIEVADMLPETTVRGVDLFPPPVSWLPPNCILEVDDILEDWTWREPFDFIHLRILDCAFTPEETENVYKQCYDHMQPGGWIEQLEMSCFLECDDESMAEDSILRTWGPRLTKAADRSGRRFGIMHTMRDSIARAGFTDIHVKEYKLPVGPWPRDKRLKEIGSVNFHHWADGMDGYSMWLLTRYGDPVPWSKDEVLVYVAQMRKEISNPRNHCYHRATRIWAKRPLEQHIRADPIIKAEPSP